MSSPATDLRRLVKNHPFLSASSAAALTLGALMAAYPDRAAFHPSRKEIPRYPGWPLLGSLPLLLQYRDKIYDALQEGFERVGSPTTFLSALGMPMQIGTADPVNVEYILKTNFENYVKGPTFHSAMDELFGNGIFNADGEQWKYQRKTAANIFNVKNFRDHFTVVFLLELKYMRDNIFDLAVESGQAFDFHDIMYKFTLDSFILLGFGVDLGALKQQDKHPFAASFDIAQANVFQRMLVPGWRAREAATRLLMPWKTSMSYHVRVVDNFARQIVRDRLEESKQLDYIEKSDLLSRFIQTSNAEGEPLSETELRDIIVNFVIAGRDTTAQALSWTFYELMMHKDVEQRLVEDIMEHITDDIEDDPVALYEAIKDMKYAHAVFYEVLRLYPSVPLNQKYALNDDVLPDGTQIRKGDYVVWCPYAQGRLVGIWGQDARQFNPDRWLNEAGELKRVSQGQWPAFHAGPRVCLGQNLATLEALLTISLLLKRYKFTLAPWQNVTYQVSITLPMREGMKVFLEKRQG
ncbi:hypothetical protein INT43_002782 [Umbelopsis isabellina]|uniref:Cytochrome P450 n=1 Tax=Mortierella isabellina TaxID=91625 RepID=A0A8H7Q4H5_MORIS|nr:hypothetical protein INT43_002782 [Umbelopsis isabellina]